MHVCNGSITLITVHAGITPLKLAPHKSLPPRKSASATAVDQSAPTLPTGKGSRVSSSDLPAQLGDLQKTISGITDRVVKLEGDSNGMEILASYVPSGKFCKELHLVVLSIPFHNNIIKIQQVLHQSSINILYQHFISTSTIYRPNVMAAKFSVICKCTQKLATEWTKFHTSCIVHRWSDSYMWE